MYFSSLNGGNLNFTVKLSFLRVDIHNILTVSILEATCFIMNQMFYANIYILSSFQAINGSGSSAENTNNAGNTNNTGNTNNAGHTCTNNAGNTNNAGHTNHGYTVLMKFSAVFMVILQLLPL